jgi:hypothetical protein
MRAWILVLALAACGEEEPAGVDRTPCEQSCFDVRLRPCRDRCDQTHGTDAAARDACHGECIRDYDLCVAESC